MKRNSKVLQGISYQTSKVGSYRYLDVFYKGKTLYRGSSYPVKVSRVIQAVEGFIAGFDDILEQAFKGEFSATYSDSRANELFSRLSNAFQSNRS